MIEQFGFTSLREVIAALFLLSGLVFFVGSAIGMLRLPDFYSRIHPPVTVKLLAVRFPLSV